MWATHDGARRYLLARAHVDTGFMTLLAQDGVSGLQAQHLDGSWIDVPPEEGRLAINFGKVSRTCARRAGSRPRPESQVNRLSALT